jgi:hypothetical protein
MTLFPNPTRPQVDPTGAPAFAEKCRSDLARLRGDAAPYQDLLGKIHCFSAAIIPAWKSTCPAVRNGIARQISNSP